MRRCLMLAVVALVLLPGCFLSWPPGSRRATPSELEAIEYLREQYAIDGHDIGSCSVFEDVYVSVNDQETTTGLCGRRWPDNPVIACVHVVNVSLADIPGSVLIKATEGLGWRSHHSIMIHEANHVMHGCAGIFSGGYDHSNETWRGHAPGELGTEGRAFERWNRDHGAIPVPDPFAPMTLPTLDSGARDAR